MNDLSGEALAQVLYEEETVTIRRKLRQDGSAAICKITSGDHAAERVRNEVRILRRLEGVAGVLQPKQVFETELQFEDISAVSFGSALKQGYLQQKDPAAIALSLAHTLASIHGRGVSHRNLHSGCIFLNILDNSPAVFDFSLATTFAEGRPDFTSARKIPGILTYLAPEQTGRTGRPVDYRADLYSLGVVLYELCTGNLPFVGDDPLQLIHQHLAVVPVPPAQRNSSVNAMFSEMVMRLLEKEPDRRYQSAEGLVCDLTHLSTGKQFAIGERDFPMHLSASSRLIGRDGDIRGLQTAFEAAITGGGSRVVLISGAPGVGKTALINNLRPFVTKRRGWMVSGKFDQFRRDDAGFLHVFSLIGQLLLTEEEGELSRECGTLLAALQGNAHLIARLIPEFATLLSIEAKEPENDAGEAQLQNALLEILRVSASPERPLAIVLDDIQWADASAIKFIDAVLEDPGLSGVFLVAAFRDSEIAATHPLATALSRWERSSPPPLVLGLKNLPPVMLAELLEEMLRTTGDTAAKLADSIGSRTDGNPYDTLELLNGLRRDGALYLDTAGWQWNATAIRQFIGSGDVAGLIQARIASLPRPTQALVEQMACLGSELEVRLLSDALGLHPARLEELLIPALEEGLLLAAEGSPSLGVETVVRFRHDRIQQAAFTRMPSPRRMECHLSLARALAASDRYRSEAAQQYLPAIDLVADVAERGKVAELFLWSATNARVAMQYETAEELLIAAARLLDPTAPGNTASLVNRQLHLVLYSRGRFSEADALYEKIADEATDPVSQTAPACVQISSLSNRGRQRDAVDLGLSLLRRLGLEGPREAAAEVEERVDSLCKWVASATLDNDLSKPEVSDPRIVAAATLLNRIVAPAFFCEPIISVWITTECQRLWALYGPCAPLVAALSTTTILTITARNDYRTGYTAVRHALRIGEARGYEPETSWARHCFSLFTSHWFEPLEHSIPEAEKAREGLLRGGDLQFACFTHYTSLAAGFDCSRSVTEFEPAIKSALSFADRTGNDHARAAFVCYHQLLAALRGETLDPGRFDDATFDEAGHVASLQANPMAAAFFHIYRAVGAAILADRVSLEYHSVKAMEMLPFVHGFYPTSLAYFLRGLSVAESIREGITESGSLLDELTRCHEWLQARAADAPDNFQHLVYFLEAERAWSLQDFQGACQAFDLALRKAANVSRPWHQALITEHAGRFYLQHDLEGSGQDMLSEARELYRGWGATAKQVEVSTSSPRRSPTSKLTGTYELGISSDQIDNLAILRASQALSSETSMAKLTTRVIEILSSLTGATQVFIALHDAGSGEWEFSSGDGRLFSREHEGLAESVPLSVFRYVERTLQSLILHDTQSDARFLQDPYFTGKPGFSLLVSPILHRGALTAVLILENQLCRAAFSSGHLDAVALIAGQLSVSLENVRLYSSLEAQVARRTDELANSLAFLQATLESTTDGILAVDRQGVQTGYNEIFLQTWKIDEITPSQSANDLLIASANRLLTDPEPFIEHIRKVAANPEVQSFQSIQFNDGRIVECYSKPQQVDERTTGYVWSFRDITERRRAELELERINRQLFEVSRRAGMSEVATDVLHNMGNILNRATVASRCISERLRNSKIGNLAKVAELIEQHQAGLHNYLSEDAKGRLLPEYLSRLSAHLTEERAQLLKDISDLQQTVDHLCGVVTKQESYAGVQVPPESVTPAELLESGIEASGIAKIPGVTIRQQVSADSPLVIERNKAVKILASLLQNAADAYSGTTGREKLVLISVSDTGNWVEFAVADEGAGLSADNLVKIFSQGFVTGSNISLHDAALAAKQLGGTLAAKSAGDAQGSTFVLRLPAMA